MNLDAILVAEDEPTDVFFLEHAFETVGLLNPLYVVKNGQEAVDYLNGTGLFANRLSYPLPRLVLLDINMPQKSGLEVLEWIRQQPVLHSLPVIMLTSSSHPADLQRARELKADDYLLKPSKPRQLVELVKSINARWLSSSN